MRRRSLFLLLSDTTHASAAATRIVRVTKAIKKKLWQSLAVFTILSLLFGRLQETTRLRNTNNNYAAFLLWRANQNNQLLLSGRPPPLPTTTTTTTTATPEMDSRIHSSSSSSSSQQKQQLQQASTNKEEDDDDDETATAREQMEQQQPFDWERLSTSSKSPCGAHKCLFSTTTTLSSSPPPPPSSSSSSYDHRDDEDNDNDVVGYLVVQDGPARTKSMQQAFDLGQFLEKSFRVKHVFLEPPVVTYISTAAAAKLNSNLYYPEESTTVDDMFEQGNITIQKVRIISSDSSLLFGCTSEKKHLFWDHLQEFLKESVPDKMLFATNVIRNLQTSMEIVDKVRCLGYDFQVFVDATGEFYHFDLDRCFMRSPESEEKFMRRFDKRTKQLQQMMDEILLSEESSSRNTNER